MSVGGSITDIKYYSDVEESDVEWLWFPYVPLGKITLLQGDPGDGKSTFMIHLVAAVTAGRELPDGSKAGTPQNVIYQCSEDNSSDTIKPRLIAAGADCKRVAFINEEEEPLSIGDTRIEEAIISTGARLLILDPLQAYIPPECDMMNAASMRFLMKGLARLAEKYKCAVVLIGHMTKSSGSKHLYRGLGSIDIAAVARSVLMIRRDEEIPAIRYMFPVKSSLAFEGSAIRFLFDKEAGFRMLGPCEYNMNGNGSAADTEKESKLERAELFLQQLLSEGRLPSKSALSVIEDYGISERTIRTAAKNVNVKSVREGGIWYWELAKS